MSITGQSTSAAKLSPAQTRMLESLARNGGVLCFSDSNHNMDRVAKVLERHGLVVLARGKEHFTWTVSLVAP